MLTLVNDRYEATLEHGTRISVSRSRVENDAYNRAVQMDPHIDWKTRYQNALDSFLQHPAVYRTKHNGFSVVVLSKKSK